MSLAVEIEHKKQNIKNTPLHRHLRNKETTGKPIQSRRPVLLYRLSHICPQFSGKILQNIITQGGGRPSLVNTSTKEGGGCEAWVLGHLGLGVFCA
ncbi:unnamed protein product [Prunus armeniaca]|uniref:Uncharacterized protein n=1 Tax=Prunus armeniaca TaxID=36596 RepID=A0A6J5US73_PRUAR|nr:unnamed protein product [Prunus armeniaca]